MMCGFSDTRLGRSVSFQYMRTLECAIRHLSFQKAAQELGITPSAVSQQIKKLEQQCGVQFFERLPNQLVLTATAKACFEYLHQGMRMLTIATNQIENIRAETLIRISAAPSFASKWLLPRLDRFHEHHPGIDLRLEVTAALADLTAGHVDVALRYGCGTYPGLYSELLADEVVFPVCSPSLLPDRRTLNVEELSHFVLLHDESDEIDPACPDWRSWFASVGALDRNYGRGIRINQSSLVIDAAAAGKGVALAKGLIAAGDLAAGRIVKPVNLETRVSSGYYLVCSNSSMERVSVAAFRKWLLAEMVDRYVAA